MSKIKKIYIIRHGETEYNRLGIVQGSGIDSDLNIKGNLQAKAFFDLYSQIPFDKIYTSTLKRTHQSVQLFLEKNIAWEQHNALNEISWGNREGKIPDVDDNLHFSKMTQNWCKGQTHLSFENGESPNEVAQRQRIFINYILEKKEEKTILIAMHGRALKILLSMLKFNDLSKMDHFEHRNLCLYQLEYNYGTQQFEIIHANNILHLEQAETAQ